MASAPKHCIALDNELNEAPWGKLFIDPASGKTFNLNNVEVVHFGTDTVRQLYKGQLQPEVMALFDEPGMVSFAGERWSAGRIGRDSGYQYRLQNADLGLILLIKSFHAQIDAVGPHLKIEVSPHCLRSQTPQQLQATLNHFAEQILIDPEPAQCAVHIALDVQGWTPPRDFETKLHCRSRRVRSYHGIDTVEFDTSSAVYGRGESFLFGSPAGIQLAVYDKTQEAKLRDKLDYWRSVWSEKESYQDDQPVYRIEFRFHHSVVEQFAQGSINKETGEVLAFRDYADLFDHLGALWRYGCDSFRYLYRPGWFDPFWTLIARQALPTDPPEVDYKRYYKTSSGYSGKNVELLLGNYISCAARHRMSHCQAWKALEALPFFQLILDHYRDRGKKTWEVKKHVKDLLEERYIRYGKAI